ncbi:DUF3108 domain-containing protein [uncultured Cohaesibacter sp.]|uniref:DUF3108 domain-containing protein n=1 Tax=uncultured Cohaesibacter sp. TaxID=1002546 RepID=UPI00292E7FF4|nr:DUF3108 domain-containing protein [uncultured Cohaesibacter sp.]
MLKWKHFSSRWMLGSSDLRHRAGLSRAPLALGLLAGLIGVVPQVSATEIGAKFSIYVAGIPVGGGSVSASVKGHRYEIDAFAQTSGISRLFIDSKGRAVSKGSFSGERILPSMYALNSKEARIHNVVQIAMHSGNVSDFSASPPLIKREDRIPLTRVHTRGIVDPLSSLLMSVRSKNDRVGKSVCDRTIRMFDGRWRYNIELFYKGMKDIKGQGADQYSGPATVCGARVRFVAGHRPDNSSTKSLENNKDIEAWFIPVADDPVVAIYRLQIGTNVGRMVLAAKEMHID